MGSVPDADLQLAICAACGTQFGSIESPKRCHICDVDGHTFRVLYILTSTQDPRQYVPLTGQAWTSLSSIQEHYENVVEPLPGTNGEIYTILTQPRFPIGQRAFLIRTPHGNVLWDLVALIDDDTVRKIYALGGISAIVISHPHFYTTHLTWSSAFSNVPVFLAHDDQEWLARPDTLNPNVRRFISGTAQEIVPGSGVTAIQTGGHFPGSLVLHYQRRLFTADSVMVVPSGLYDIDRPAGTVSFAFMWSYPNMIPLHPSAIAHIIKTLQPYEFDIVHGGFSGQDIQRDAKRKLEESARIVQAAVIGAGK